MAGLETADPTVGTGGGALGAIDRVLHRIEKLTALVSGFGIFALMMVGVAQILSRKILNWPIFGYIDIVEFMMTFLVFLGLAYTERIGGHIRMEAILVFIKGRWLWVFELVGVVVGLAVVGVLAIYSWEHAMRALWIGDSTMDAQIPWWPSKIVVPIALGLLFIRLVVSLWGYVRLLADPDAKPIAVPELIDTDEQARREAAAAEAALDREMRHRGLGG